jgi:tetratricopeptide (TPR) repeat protein
MKVVVDLLTARTAAAQPGRPQKTRVYPTEFWGRMLCAFWLWPAILPAQPADTLTLARQAVELQQSGDYAGAAEAYRKLTALNPGDVVAHVNLGISLVQLGRFDEAIAEYQTADKLLPNDNRIALNLALAYQKSGRLLEATQRFEALHAAAPEDPRLTLLLADCLLQTGHDTRVVDLLQPLAPQRPDDLGLAYMLGMAFLHTGNLGQGQAFLDRILRNGDSVEARFLMGTRMFESGDYPAAVKQLAAAIELNPRLPQLQSLYGRALLNTGDPDAAAGAFRKELATNPNDFAANLGLGQILAARKQLHDAIPPLRRALLLRPQSTDAQSELALALVRSGEFAEARPLAESAVNSVPDSPEAHRTLSGVYAGLHLAREASHELETAQSLEKSARASAPGPKVDEIAPDFDLPNPVSGKKLRLSSFRGKTPVVLVFGSYSCPNFRASAAALKELAKTYASKIPFVLVYIREAHSSDNWESTRNIRDGISIGPAATMTDKENHAIMCSRELHLSFPAVVDGMDGAVEGAYSAWPSRAFVVGADGRIQYSTRLTELDFHIEEMEAVLRKLTQPKLTQPKPTQR